jgi:hypothetical protein
LKGASAVLLSSVSTRAVRARSCSTPVLTVTRTIGIWLRPPVRCPLGLAQEAAGGAMSRLSEPTVAVKALLPGRPHEILAAAAAMPCRLHNRPTAAVRCYTVQCSRLRHRPPPLRPLPVPAISGRGRISGRFRLDRGSRTRGCPIPYRALARRRRRRAGPGTPGTAHPGHRPRPGISTVLLFPS